MAKKNFRIGLDIGGTKILAGAVNAAGRLVASAKARTVIDEGERYFFNTVTELVRHVMDEAKISACDIAGIGAGCPGVINADDNIVVHSPNIPFLDGYPLGRRLEKEFGVKAAVENDVNMGLYGEYCFGAAKGRRYVAGFFLGTGIGGALILDGKLYRGFSGAAGEFGHICLEYNGPACGCGNRGCLEALVARLAVSGEAAVLAARGKAPALLAKAGTDLRAMKSGVLAKAVQADAEVRELVKFKARQLGLAMGTVVNIIDPEMIVLGGGMIEALGDVILPEAVKGMKAHALSVLAKNVQVVPAKLGDLAAVMGAARMAADRE